MKKKIDLTAALFTIKKGLKPSITKIGRKILKKKQYFSVLNIEIVC